MTDLGANFETSSPFPDVNIFAFGSRSSTETILGWIAALLEDRLSLLKQPTVGRGPAILGVRSLNLPQVFFMDRGKCISTTLVRDGYEIKGLKVAIVDLHERADSLPEFLEAMNDNDRGERSFLTYDLRNVGKTINVGVQIILFRKLPLNELANLRPDWRSAIENSVLRAEERGLALHGVILSPFVNIASLPTLRALAETPLFREETVSITDNLDSVKASNS